MGYPVNGLNSFPVEYKGHKLAIACIHDEEVGEFDVGVFWWTGTEWDDIPGIGEVGGFIKEGVTNDTIAASGPGGVGGTTYTFLLSCMPEANMLIKTAFDPSGDGGGLMPVKPTQPAANKVDNVIFDIVAGGLTFDATVGEFGVKPPAQLPHNL